MLVNNAGAAFPGGRSEYEPEVFEESLRINLAGAYRMDNFGENKHWREYFGQAVKKIEAKEKK